MPTNKMVAFVFAIVMALAMANTCVAQNSPQDYVDAHNTARADVGVEGVSWDTTVEAYAQSYADQRIADCALLHSGSDTYGENIYTGQGTGYEDGIDAVAYWVSEKEYYDYDSNSCSAGEDGCLHYTQVVWNTSTTIGCARVVCDNDAGVFIICNYYPRGNLQGEKPY